MELEGAQAQAEALQALERCPLVLGLPESEATRALVQARNSKIAPAHKGSFEGPFQEHETWFVYALELRGANGKRLAVKVGYESDPMSRVAHYNVGLAPEVTGLRLAPRSPAGRDLRRSGRAVEQGIFARFKAHRLASNGEILTGVTPKQVISAAMDVMISIKA